jgi:ABC-type transporter Mla maintaining outer membrane lipid asymmetry permease subunit MlaE
MGPHSKRCGRRRRSRRAFALQTHKAANIEAISIAVLTASFTGMVLALQGHDTLQRFGSESQVGPLVALSLLRELSPVLAGIVIAARPGRRPRQRSATCV